MDIPDGKWNLLFCNNNDCSLSLETMLKYEKKLKDEKKKIINVININNPFNPVILKNKYALIPFTAEQKIKKGIVHNYFLKKYNAYINFVFDYSYSDQYYVIITFDTLTIKNLDKLLDLFK